MQGQNVDTKFIQELELLLKVLEIRSLRKP